MEPLATLFEQSAMPAAAGLPEPLRKLYGGHLAFPQSPGRPYVVANFVSTLDGVVSYDIAGSSGGGHVSGFNPQDAFVIGLLRACADAVMVGAGTLHGDPGHVRTASFIFPEAQRRYAELRQALGKTTLHPLNVIISGSGRVDLAEPTFHTPGLKTLIVTSRAGCAHLEATHGAALATTRVATAGDGPALAPEVILTLLYRDLGVRLLVHEGGPTLLGPFLAEGLIDELFLTIAPWVAGRSTDTRRPGLVEGVTFSPEAAPGLELVSAKQAGDHLLLRYRAQLLAQTMGRAAPADAVRVDHGRTTGTVTCDGNLAAR
ncbi:MAG: dihydrofolate reductase family protein [Gemmatimonadetes bacterium]|nr:dihydrofolate reductase family protein [Gemmatimonadota bacterium]